MTHAAVLLDRRASRAQRGRVRLERKQKRPRIPEICSPRLALPSHSYAEREISRLSLLCLPLLACFR